MGEPQKLAGGRARGTGSLRIAVVQAMHGALSIAGQQLRHYLQGTGDRRIDRLLLLHGGTIEYGVDDQLLGTGMTDAEPQAPEIRPEMGDHIAQPVVPAVAATVFEACNP